MVDLSIISIGSDFVFCRYRFSSVGEKELKPVSFRVREAAECVLAFIMEQTVNHVALQNFWLNIKRTLIVVIPLRGCTSVSSVVTLFGSRAPNSE